MLISSKFLLHVSAMNSPIAAVQKLQISMQVVLPLLYSLIISLTPEFKEPLSLYILPYLG